MEYFWTDGGHRPWFSYRITVPKCTDEMFVWCKNYNDEGQYFRRFHVEWASSKDNCDYDIVQFEWEQAAIDFSLRWL